MLGKEPFNDMMIEISQLEPFGIFTLASGLLYSIGVLILQSHGSFKFHFIVLTLVIFMALLSISFFKYLKYRHACPHLNDILEAMNPKIE